MNASFRGFLHYYFVAKTYNNVKYSKYSKYCLCDLYVFCPKMFVLNMQLIKNIYISYCFGFGTTHL